MRIAIVRNIEAVPRTRRELLQHIWAYPELCGVNVYKEGPRYAMRTPQYIHATGIRRIDMLSFKSWEALARSNLAMNHA